jgi:hypothetical protein
MILVELGECLLEGLCSGSEDGGRLMKLTNIASTLKVGKDPPESESLVPVLDKTK